MLDNVVEDDDEQDLRARNNQNIKAAVQNKQSKDQKASKNYVSEKLVDESGIGGKLTALKILNEKLQDGNAGILKRRQLEKDNPRIAIEFFKPPVSRPKQAKTFGQFSEQKLLELVNMKGDQIEEYDKDSRNPSVYMNIFTQEHSDVAMVAKYLTELQGLNARRNGRK